MKKSRLVALVSVLALVAALFAGCGGSNNQTQTTGGQGSTTSAATKKIVLGVAIRSLTNPYQATVVDGAKMFAEYLKAQGVDAEVQTLECNGSDDKQINDIKALVAKTGKDLILYVDPNQAPDAAEIAQICEDAGVYWTCAWNKPDEIDPSQFPHWVNFQSPDDSISGYNIATAMFKKFKTPGKGKILAIQGMLANNAAVNRFKGLQKALSENTGVQLLDQQAGDWDPQKALSIAQTWLAKYQDIDGIWVANDDMAVAVVQALKAKGLNGKVQVVGVDGTGAAVDAIKAGDMTATVGSNGWAQGGWGLDWCWQAYTGKIDTQKEDQSLRMVNTKSILITTDTVKDYEASYITNAEKINFDDLNWFIDHPMGK